MLEVCNVHTYRLTDTHTYTIYHMYITVVAINRFTHTLRDQLSEQSLLCQRYAIYRCRDSHTLTHIHIIYHMYITVVVTYRHTHTLREQLSEQSL